MNTQQMLSILQYNVHNSKDIVMAPLLRDPKTHSFDILAIQEPWRNPYNHTTHTPNTQQFTLLYPNEDHSTARVCMFINKRLNPTKWKFTHHTTNLCSIQLQLSSQDNNLSQITVFNVYNPNTRNTEDPTGTLSALQEAIQNTNGPYVVVGDFNLHNPIWGGISPQTMTNEAAPLLEIMEECNLTSCLPQGTITWRRNDQNSCIDLVLASHEITERIIHCQTSQQINHDSDHFPIHTIIDVRAQLTKPKQTYIWKNTNPKTFHEALRKELLHINKPTSTAEIDAAIIQILQAYNKAAEAGTPKSNPSIYAKYWWTDKCAQARTNTNRLRRSYQQHPSEESWKEYQQARNMKGRIIAKELRRCHREQIETTSADPKGIWKLAKWARTRNMVMKEAQTVAPTLRNDTIIATTPESKSELLTQRFFPYPPEADLSDIPGSEYPRPINMPSINEVEVKRAIQATKPWKAAGTDNIPNGIYQMTSAFITPVLTKIYQACLLYGYCPEHFRKSITIVLRKANKANYEDPKSYRPIALLNTIGKILEAILANRLSYCVERYQLLPTHHIGGRKGKSTDTAIHTMLGHIYKAWDKNQAASVLLLDVSGAYDYVSHPRLLHNLRKRRIDTQIVNWISSFLQSRTTTLKFDSYISPLKRTCTGIPQGSPLSPILYLFYNADLVDIGNEDLDMTGIGYIDDIGVIATEQNTENTCKAIEAFHTKAARWAKQHASIFDPQKYQFIHFTKTKNELEFKRPVTVSNIIKTPTSSIKYLGIHLDPKLKWQAQRESVKEKTHSTIKSLQALAGSTWGATLQDYRRLYLAIAVPQILYGSSAWAVNDNTKYGIPIQDLNALNSLQGRVACAITGAFRATSHDALNVEAYLKPMHLQLQQHKLSTAIHIASSHNTGIPDIYEYQTKNRDKQKTRLPPIQKTLQLFEEISQINPRKQEIIVPFLTPPWWTPPHIQIEESAGKAIKSHDKTTTNSQSLAIYTDGSGIDGEVGTAATAPTIKATLCTYMGPETTSTVYAAELRGIHMALLIANAFFQTHNPQDIYIYTDNQASIETLQNPTGRSGGYIIYDIIYEYNKLLYTHNIRASINWIPSHVGIPGNEAADKEAKKAARTKGQFFPTKVYPLKATANTWIKQHTINTWTKEWRESSKGRTSYKHTPVPTDKTLALHKNLPKRYTSIITQMRTGKIGLQDYLHHRQVPGAITSKCSCGAPRQTTEHILFVCPEHKSLRKETILKLPYKERSSIQTILSKQRTALIAAKFIESTLLLGQFRQEGLIAKTYTQGNG